MFRNEVTFSTIFVFTEFENRSQDFKTHILDHRSIRYNVNLSMPQKRFVPFESFIALAALERSESIVISHVTLQLT